MSTSARFYLKISPEGLLEYYQGRKQFVRVQTFQGYSLRFRADHLRRWVTPHGIDGVFEIRFDERRSFKELVMVSRGPASGGGRGQGGGSRGSRGGGRPGGFSTSV
jgi:hypothetical protein